MKYLATFYVLESNNYYMNHYYRCIYEKVKNRALDEILLVINNNKFIYVSTNKIDSLQDLCIINTRNIVKINITKIVDKSTAYLTFK